MHAIYKYNSHPSANKLTFCSRYDYVVRQLLKTQLENYSKLMITCYIYKTTPEPEETMQKRGGTERLQELG